MMVLEWAREGGVFGERKNACLFMCMCVLGKGPGCIMEHPLQLGRAWKWEDSDGSGFGWVGRGVG